MKRKKIIFYERFALKSGYNKVTHVFVSTFFYKNKLFYIHNRFPFHQEPITYNIHSLSVTIPSLMLTKMADNTNSNSLADGTGKIIRDK